MNPLTCRWSSPGFIFYFRTREGKPYRALGWLFVVLYVFFTLTRAKSYFLSPAYPMLFAGGAIVLARRLRSSDMAGAGRASSYAAALALSGVLLPRRYAGAGTGDL